MKVLTKSRFKEGLSCPNKLYYTKKKEYANTKSEDPFLKALAQGGFQVEELARLHYPQGQLILDTLKYEEPWQQTRALLEREDQVIYEAAFWYESLFVRCDILEKKGNHLRLIEVKSKSFDPNKEHQFVTKKGTLNGAWKPYLFDLAFQTYVIRKCYPEYTVSAHLMLADKWKTASVDGLNQMFRVSEKAQDVDTLRTGIVKNVDSLEDCGRSILGEVDLTEVIDAIIAGEHEAVNGLNFLQSIAFFTRVYANDEYANAPVDYGSCKGCEYRATEDQIKEDKRSGFEECFKKQLNWGRAEFEKPKTWEVWDFRRGSNLFAERGVVFQEELSEELVGVVPLAEKISRTERQWLQIEKTLADDKTPYVDRENLRAEMRTWRYPLNMIDFETCMMALPFHAGRRPYEQVAFQFSHHLVHEDGRVEHKTEFIEATPGVFPNFEFVRALKRALEQNNGTIFRYSHHENTVLNQIAEQLAFSSEPDKQELLAFIAAITHEGTERYGDRNMVDLCQVVIDYYYHPLFGGSNSLKVVLPAILETSELLINKYSKPLGQLNLSSLNFGEDKVWLTREKNKVVNPYKTLEPIFGEWDAEQLNNVVSELDDIADGGAALTAYSKLQMQEMDEPERKAIESALLKYCELDTLAMVMLYEHLNEQLKFRTE